MEHVLAERGLCLTYLCDPTAIDELDQDRILDDLSEDTDNGPYPWLTRSHLADHDHLILVSDRSSGRHIALLAADDCATEREDFLLLETVFVTPAARGQNLARRMIALALLRIGGIRAVPSVVAAATRDPVCHRILRGVARRFTTARFYPDLDSTTINFHTATLARRIAREIRPRQLCQALAQPFARDPRFASMFGPCGPSSHHVLAILDMRGQDETTIFDDARRLYRSR